ncbi:MAG TPA: leucyl/phenylalanyl-tRNA--protein transferase [Chiayiivirga sp.]|nr:leucyl/phenylalanyl-tRNA--protein transferase [Chiayiivirga sp.]
MRLPCLGSSPDAPFPNVDRALEQPNGLLAFGGDLSVTRLMRAYRQGIFPWYSEGQPILWWSPEPRAVFDTGDLHLSRRLRRALRARDWTIHADRNFGAVLDFCASVPRHDQAGTWIGPEMKHAYMTLAQAGFAHSVEVHDAERLIGGVYGVNVGPVFCGESMFGLESGASSLALAALCRWLSLNKVPWLDAQMPTPHLRSLGVRCMARSRYLELLAETGECTLTDSSWSDAMPTWRPRDLFECTRR